MRCKSRWVRARSFAPLLALVLPAAASAGCIVPKRDLDQCVAASAQQRAAAVAQQSADAARVADLQQRLSAAEATAQDRAAKLSDLSTAQHNMQAQLDEATAINQQLRGELERMGKDADTLLADRGTLSKALDDAKARLEELRKAQAAAEVRAALFRDFATRFKGLIDAGQLSIVSRHGSLVMDIAGDLLFDPGRAEVRPAGKGVLMEVAKAIETTSAPPPAPRLLVVDHVDDEPLKGRGFHGVWALTAARAAAVVEYLVSLGVHPESLTPAGGGSADPVAPNDTPEHRAQNRRVEIALWPAADDGLPAH